MMDRIPTERKRYSIFDVFKFPKSVAARFTPSTDPIRRDVRPAARRRDARKQRRELRTQAQVPTRPRSTALNARERRVVQREAAARLYEMNPDIYEPIPTSVSSVPDAAHKYRLGALKFRPTRTTSGPRSDA